MFKTLATHHFHAKLSKCTFAATTIQYLGHVISSHGVAADPKKIEAIKSWPIPTNFTTLCGFLGLAGYYRRFVRNYAHTAAALTDLLRKSTFEWSKAALDSFNNLKTAMTSLVFLTLPNFTAPFEVTTDASNIPIGAVLRFRIFTDQRSLKHLLTQVVQTPEQYKWVTKLLGFDFEIIYKPGRDNKVADALSRIPDATLFAISVTEPAWLSDLRAFYTSAAGQKLITKLTTTETANNQIVLCDGLLYADNHLYIPNGSPIRSKLLEEYHSSTLGGHSGVLPTMRRLSTTFYWLGLKKDVTEFIRECRVCQQVKYPTHKPYGLLQPLPIPSQVCHNTTTATTTSHPAPPPSPRCHHLHLPISISTPSSPLLPRHHYHLVTTSTAATTSRPPKGSFGLTDHPQGRVLNTRPILIRAPASLCHPPP
nr:hypothetical protein [Tanacetum cinerariifolium]